VPLSTSRPTVLVVESSSVRNLIGAVLEKEQYTVVLEDVPGARQLLQAAASIDLLITNEPWWFEPFASGLRVLYVSGAPDREFLQKHRSATFGYLQKPFRFQELLLSVHLLLERQGEAAATVAPCPIPRP
jgi:DNA-binding NtrC family response regulator